jgi:hypothetical protein
LLGDLMARNFTLKVDKWDMRDSNSEPLHKKCDVHTNYKDGLIDIILIKITRNKYASDIESSL